MAIFFVYFSSLFPSLALARDTKETTTAGSGQRKGRSRDDGGSRFVFFCFFFLIPSRINPKVKLFRLAIHYSRLTCRNYFGHGELPLKRQLESHKYAMRIYQTAGLAFPPKTVLRPLPNDRNFYRCICDRIHRSSMELRRVAKSVVTTSRSHVRHGHITANVLSANRARVKLKLVTDTNKNDVSGEYYLAPMSRSDTNERLILYNMVCSVRCSFTIHDDVTINPFNFSKAEIVSVEKAVELISPRGLHFRGHRPSDQRTCARMQASAKILSGLLAVIEIAFAAVYSVVHAARRRQKGFDLAANFLGENGSGSAVATMIAPNRLPSISVSTSSGVCDGHARHSGNSHDFLVALTRVDPNHPPVRLHITAACPLPIVIYGLRGRPTCSPDPSLRCTWVHRRSLALYTLLAALSTDLQGAANDPSRMVQPLSLSSGTKGQPAREKLRLVQHK
ncbi:hypothetical protein ALC56_10056 [Trachymyrmex septentrionalis]|uniref:Uncharacterized protein n=1 Tax=Trachymyrmex septentrionalis TaxID=34720 RepID=A0A195F603_9HYME|nr:hypothetical protein ALC56_10056 [Trachymyrmex septentrionalis]